MREERKGKNLIKSNEDRQKKLFVQLKIGKGDDERWDSRNQKRKGKVAGTE